MHSKMSIWRRVDATALGHGDSVGLKKAGGTQRLMVIGWKRDTDTSTCSP